MEDVALDLLRKWKEIEGISDDLVRVVALVEWEGEVSRLLDRLESHCSDYGLNCSG